MSSGSGRRAIDFSEDVDKFVRMYSEDNLFSKVPERAHSSFLGFKYEFHIHNPGELKQRLRKIPQNSTFQDVYCHTSSIRQKERASFYCP